MTAALHLAPGPTLIDITVIQAMADQPMYHQSSEFAEVMDETCDLLKPLYGTAGEVVVLPSSGRGAVEAALTSVRDDGRVLVVASNGAFGRMMVGIGKAVGLDVVEIAVPDGQPLPAEQIVDALDGARRPILGVVHNETSTGVVNDLSGLADLVHRQDGLLLVDAVSSLGGMPVEVDRLGIDLCAAASQKAVGAPPGLGFVSVSGRALAELNRPSRRVMGHYLDLRRWWQQWVPTEQGGQLLSGYRRLPWTMPTNVVLALRRSLQLAAEEGVPARWSRHLRCAAALRAAMATLGLRPVAWPEGESSTVGAFHVPQDQGRALRNRLVDRHQVHLAGGMGEDADSVIRVAHMAESARPGPLLHAIATIAHELREFGPAPAADPTGAFLDVWCAPDCHELADGRASHPPGR